MQHIYLEKIYSKYKIYNIAKLLLEGTLWEPSKSIFTEKKVTKVVTNKIWEYFCFTHIFDQIDRNRDIK